MVMVLYPSKYRIVFLPTSYCLWYSWIFLFNLSRDEFVKSYVDTRQKLIEREQEVMREMVDHARQQDEVMVKLEEAERYEDD